MADAQNYHAALKTIPNLKKLLILGTTPELRVVASDFVAHPMVADFSLPMIRATDIMLPRDVVQKEEKLLMGWLDLPSHIESHSCDAVVGDLVIRQIFSASTRVFLKGIHDIVKKGGVFITRTNIRNEVYRKENAIQIILEAAQKVFLKNAADNVYTYMFQFYDACTDPASGSLSLGLVRQSFEEALKSCKDFETEKNIKNLQKIFGNPTVPWTHLTKKAVEEAAVEFFYIKNVLFSQDYPDATLFPLYVFEAK